MTTIEEQTNLDIYHLLQYPASYHPMMDRLAIPPSLPCTDTAATNAT